MPTYGYFYSGISSKHRVLQSIWCQILPPAHSEAFRGFNQPYQGIFSLKGVKYSGEEVWGEQ